VKGHGAGGLHGQQWVGPAVILPSQR